MKNILKSIRNIWNRFYKQINLITEYQLKQYDYSIKLKSEYS